MSDQLQRTRAVRRHHPDVRRCLAGARVDSHTRQRQLRSIRRDEDVVVAASTAAHDPAGFDAPPNARVERWLPHGQLLANAACAICHGGMGIVQKTLAAGVPACVVPFGRDQFEVGARVAAVGAGTCVTPDALDAQALRGAAKAAIDMGDGARATADAFARTGGAAAAASALESELTRIVTGAELR